MKVYEDGSLFVLEDESTLKKIPKGSCYYVTDGDNLSIRSVYTTHIRYASKAFSEYQNSSGTPYASMDDLKSDLDVIINERGGRAVSGFIDYNDTTGTVSLLEDVWTDVPNNGLGSFSNNTYKPTSISNLMDTSTGYLDFSELTLGSQIIVRNDFKINPDTNNSLLQARYLLGQGDEEYSLLFWSERLDGGSGIDYQRVPSFPIYMGDENTKGGVGKFQVKLSSTGTLTNAGSYINIQIR